MYHNYKELLPQDEKPGDLDIWARNWNCYRQAGNDQGNDQLG